MVVALIALFVALGGTGYALTITGGQIKNSTITGRDVKRNSLGGREIRESRLGTVPRAGVAERIGRRTQAQVTTRGFYSAQTGSKGFDGNGATIGSLSVPAGNYLIYAKTNVGNTGSTALTTICTIKAGADSDESSAILEPGNASSSRATLVMSSIHFSDSPFSIVLSCKSPGNTGLNLFADPPFTKAFLSKISAIRTDSLTPSQF
jgi:hypothetical protein